MSALVLRALERELLVYVRTWRGNAFTAFVQPMLFLGAMGLGLGNLVDESGTDAGGFDYLVFVAPGLLAASALLSAAGESLWGVMGGVKWMGQFNSMVATAMGPGDVYGGLVLSTGVRALVAAIPFLGIAAILGGVPSALAPLALVPTVVLAMLSSAALAAYSVRQESDSTFPIIMRLGVIPLFLFSGTFFPVGQLPELVQPLVWLSPLFHAVEAARDATAGGVDLATLGHIAVLAVLLAVAVPFGVRGFTRRLTP
ncbi:MAG: ABC transporter permease [Acidimicrobiales bacterium]